MAIKNKRSVIPNFFTTLNIFCGFLAILSIMDDKIVAACWLISLAAVFDLLDGQLARLIKTSSDFGIEFDSLADLISFGAAPSILLYKTFLSNFGVLGIIISFMPLFFGGVRLARFNVLFGGKEKTKFVGLPIPQSALCFASFMIFNYHFWDQLYLTRILIPQLLLVCILMVSPVEYYTLPKVSFKHGRKNSIGVIIIFGIVIALALFPQETFYPFAIGYVLWGLVRFVYRLVRDNENGKPVEIISES